MSLYLEHFGLNEAPFRITPHTDFFFDGADRGSTLDALLYAVVHDEGIVKVSGEVGSGKTMLCRVLMERVPGFVDIVYLATPSLAPAEILPAIADELKIELPEGRHVVALRVLQEQLIARYGEGRRVVILIDEAHAMPEATLERIRLLSNLESSRHKLLQIVLFGQPELDDVLARPSLRQLRDRITHGFRMRPLSGREVGNYLSFRLRAAGYKGPDLFSTASIKRLAAASGGLSRRLNILADKALLAAFSEGAHGVADRHAKAAIQDSEFSRVRAIAGAERSLRPALIVLGVLAALVVGLFLISASDESPAPPRPVASEQPSAQFPAEAARTTNAASDLDAASQPDRLTEPASADGSSSGHARDHIREQLLSPEALKKFDGYDYAKEKLLRERLLATRRMLSESPSEFLTVELFSTPNSDPARTERFLMRARDLVPLEELFVIPIPDGRGYLLRISVGLHERRADAEQAARRLPPKYLNSFQPVVVSVGEIRSKL